MRCYSNRIASLIGLVVLFAAGLVAGPPLLITDSGYYLTTVDSSGQPSISRIETVVDLRTGTAPPITPETPEPPAAPPEGISSDVAKWAAEVGDTDAAQRYALIFETVRDGVADDLVPIDSLFPVLRQSADLVIDDQWDTFRRKLGDYLTEELQAGRLSTTGQIRDTIELIRYGLAYSSDGSPQLSPGDALAVVSKVSSVIRGEARE